MHFLTKKQNERKIQITASNSIKTNINSTKFLDLIIDNTLSWKDHIAALASELNKACYAIRVIKPFMSVDILRMIYFSYVHSVMLYGINFWGVIHIIATAFLKLKKKIRRNITNTGSRDSCRQLFKQSQILSLPSQYIFSYLFLLTRTEVCFNQILKFMI